MSIHGLCFFFILWFTWARSSVSTTSSFASTRSWSTIWCLRSWWSNCTLTWWSRIRRRCYFTNFRLKELYILRFTQDHIFNQFLNFLETNFNLNRTTGKIHYVAFSANKRNPISSNVNDIFNTDFVSFCVTPLRNCFVRGCKRVTWVSSSRYRLALTKATAWLTDVSGMCLCGRRSL